MAPRHSSSARTFVALALLVMAFFAMPSARAVVDIVDPSSDPKIELTASGARVDKDSLQWTANLTAETAQKTTPRPVKFITQTEPSSWRILLSQTALVSGSVLLTPLLAGFVWVRKHPNPRKKRKRRLVRRRNIRV